MINRILKLTGPQALHCSDLSDGAVVNAGYAGSGDATAAAFGLNMLVGVSTALGFRAGSYKGYPVLTSATGGSVCHLVDLLLAAVRKAKAPY